MLKGPFGPDDLIVRLTVLLMLAGMLIAMSVFIKFLV